MAFQLVYDVQRYTYGPRDWKQQSALLIAYFYFNIIGDNDVAIQLTLLSAHLKARWCRDYIAR